MNLDAFNADFAALADDDERGQFLSGLSVGMNEGHPRVSAADPFIEGYTLGKSMRDEAEALRNKSTEDGAKGGYWKHKNGNVAPLVPPLSKEQSSPPAGAPLGRVNPIL